MAKVVCRIKKQKSMQSIGKVSAHNFRYGAAKLEHLKEGITNPLLVGSTDAVADVKARLEQATKNSNGGFRSNAVLAVEMLLSASPDFFQTKGNLKKWVDANMKWIKETHGDNCVNAVLHLDEQTPHIHLILVPIDSKGKLNCREFFGGKEKMKTLQDESANAVKHLGIQRGIPKEVTGAIHKTTRQWRKEQLEAANEKSSIKSAIESVPALQANFTGLVKVEKADEYYKKEAFDAVRKAYIPKMKELGEIAYKQSSLARALQKSLALKEEKEKKLEQELKESRVRNLQLDRSLQAFTEANARDLKQVYEEGYDNGYNRRRAEELAHLKTPAQAVSNKPSAPTI